MSITLTNAIGVDMIPDSTELGVWLARLQEFNTKFHKAIVESDQIKKHEMLADLAHELVIYEQILEMAEAADKVQRGYYE